MLLETLSQDFRKVRKNNATDNGFPSRVPTITEPTGVGDNAAQATASAVFELRQIEGVMAQNAVIICPFGAGANNTTMSVRLLGWRRVYKPGNEGDPGYAIWIPVNLIELACTLSSTQIGVAGRAVIDTDLFADTMTLTTGNAGVSVDLVSPANDTIAHAVADLKGFQKLEFTFTTGGSATNCNALMALL